MKSTTAAFDAMAKAAADAADAISRWIDRAFPALCQSLGLIQSVPPGWWRMLHHKRKRIRKKYASKIRRYMQEATP